MRRSCYAFILTLVLFISSVYAQSIDNGNKLFNDKRLGGTANEKSCNTCHPAGKGIDSTKFTIKGTNDSRLENIINKCIEGPLMGKALPKDSQEMKDIVAYIKSLDKH
ncbi:MAG: hypothetical protein H7843_13345 [Nitrospirota bacterium]